VVITPFSVSALLWAFDAIENATEGRETIERRGQIISLNGTGDATFALNGTMSGMYIILFLDENSSRALSATPLLVTVGTLGLQMPANITAGDFAKLKVNLSFADNRTNNQSMIFAAVMLSCRDYDNASIILQGNGSEESLNSTLTLANRSMRIVGLPRLSTDLLSKAVYLLPSDSAIGMQERKEPWADIMLITDPAWEKGGYILTCGVYSPGKGLLAVKQQAVEIV
jgi:methanogen extracellular protein (TIGR04279 family)